MAKKPFGTMLGAFGPSGSTRPGKPLPKTGSSIVRDIRSGNSPLSRTLGISQARPTQKKKKKA